MWRSPRPILVFRLVGLNALVSKIPFFVIIVINDLTQIFVLLFWWPVVVAVVLNKKIGCINPNSYGKVWRSWATRTMITMVFFIAFINLRILLRPVQSLDILKMLRKLRFKLLKFEKNPIEDFFFGMFICLEKRLMALRTANIYLLNPGQKVKSGFGLCEDGFLDGLFPDILLIVIFFSLDIDEGS